MKSKILKNTKCLLVFCLYLKFFKSTYGSTDVIPSILDEFNIHHPILVNTLIDAKDLLSIVKCISFKGHQITFSQNPSYQPYQSYLIFTNLSNFTWVLPTYAPILVVSTIQNDMELNQVDVSIGSQVLFLDWLSLKVYESYTVNKIHVTRYLGKFQDQKKSKNDGMMFFQSKDYTSCIEKRRQNFHGLQIKVATTKRRLGISDPTEFSSEIKFFPNNNTYDVTTMVATNENKERFYMVLKWLETKFNFTAKVFLRKDMKYGSPKVLSNGSIVLGEGAFRDMFEGSVDFLLTTVIMTPERALFGTFLPPIYIKHDAIYIPFIDSNEDLDWHVFVESFSTELWITVFLKCVIFSIFVYVIEWFHNYKLVGFDSSIYLCCYISV